MARPQKYNIHLTEEERGKLKAVIRKKEASKTIRSRCQIVLDLDEAHGKVLTHEQSAKSTPAAAVGTITHIGVMDSQSGGNMLARGELIEPLTFGAPSEQASGQVLIASASAVRFPRPTTNWGTWTHTAVYTAASGSEPVCVFQLTEAVELKRGYAPTFPAGTVEIGLNPYWET